MQYKKNKLALALALAGATYVVQALQIISLSPQGEVTEVRQLVAKFDKSAIRFGDPKAPPPLDISCNDKAAAQGTGRWISDREWAFEFANDLPSGVRCAMQTKLGFKAVEGDALTTAKFQFSTGGPFVKRVSPSLRAIEEEQVFLLHLNGAATTASIQEKVWCEVDDVGERIPVKMISGSTRKDILEAQSLTKAADKEPLKYITLQCNRRLSAGSKGRLVFGKGVASPTGVPNTIEKRFPFEVRQPFTLSTSCERENAQSACLPIRPITVNFSSTVTRKAAAELRLKADGVNLKPSFGNAEDAKDALVTSVQFDAVLPERTAFKLVVPDDLTDSSGRKIANRTEFPLSVPTGAMPPLAKFAAAPFGIVERFAEPDGVAMMPLTLRNVETKLAINGLKVSGKVSDFQPTSDSDIIKWYSKVVRFNQTSVERDEAAKVARSALPPPQKEDGNRVETRAIALLGQDAGVKTLDIPKASNTDPRPFEVVGVPLKPGFHVLEIASQKLGNSLLNPAYGKGRTMYVRTSALVTNLGVHFKLGRENALAWVTSLDKGKPVANAVVRVSDCTGKLVGTATTNALGIANFKDINPEPVGCRRGSEEADDETDGSRGAYFISARAKDISGVEDMAFTFSDWQRGIEPWRFNLSTSRSANPSQVAHTILDRTLLRAGETVSMKHIMRALSLKGFSLPSSTPTQLSITHVGSGQNFTQPIVWRTTATGGKSAENTFAIPKEAKLGVYAVTLVGANDTQIGTGSFRVEEFRLPVFTGSIAPESKKELIQVKELPLSVQVSYVSGGGAANLPVKVSALVKQKSISFSDYSDFTFDPPREDKNAKPSEDNANEDGQEPGASNEQRVIADKLELKLDKTGAGKITLDKLPKSSRAQTLITEATYADPNGETQTLRGTTTLWPAGVIAGLHTEGWVSAKQVVKFQALALGLNGKPAANVPLEVRAIAHVTTSSRKRMVGGFYSYDNKTEDKDLGSVCSGKSDARGLLLCESKLGQAGQVELIVTAKDNDGNKAQAASSIYVTQQGELWFGGEDHDRIDVLPEKKSYQPGDVAKFQVRMPFRFATALVSVEREGIIESQVVELNGDDPTVSLKIKEGWGPNVYVSVLVLRGRLREVPWYSFFTWGFKAPREWWSAFWYEGREYVAPTALVDLSKPAYRLGVAEIRVGTRSHEIDVTVKADQERYPTRGEAKVKISAKLPDGRPAAHAEVAFAAVDQALLELMPNNSWNLLEAMLQKRDWGVETSTAQMEIVGRRHYGKKAVPAGGGGGRSNTRELFDTLLLWNPKVVLDANGEATVNVRLNDAITSFRLVAVADLGTGQFGQGQATIKATQDLQIISGLPPLIREGDAYRAQVTLRNTTNKAMRVEVTPSATSLKLAPQTIDIPADEAREVAWDVTTPLGAAEQAGIQWNISARDTNSGTKDAIKLTQRAVVAIPLTVQQGTLVQVENNYQLPVAPPADAIAGRGGLRMSLSPKLAEGLPGVQDWFRTYPFICLEQKTSKSIGMRDVETWRSVVAQMPNYLDSDGLANYFPPRADEANHGSDTLTAYILAVSQEAAGINGAYALPDSVRDPMLRGLVNFVEGRLQRKFWSPQNDLDVRKLAALEALSRYGKVQGKMLSSLSVSPNQWPTSAVLDWVNILERVADAPNKEKRLAEARQILRARLSYQGTKIVFSTDKTDYWWWLMTNGDVNAARLILSVLNDPSWKDDMGRLASGLIGRQDRGAWQTTTANLWGGLALEKFSNKFESTPVTGFTKASLGKQSAAVDWSKVVTRPVATKTATYADGGYSRSGGWEAAAPNRIGNTMFLPWSGAKDVLSVNHSGTGKPWLTLQSVAAIQLKSPFNAGYQIKKSIAPVEVASRFHYSKGDVVRVTLEVNASADMTWVVVSDPIPGGATILGNGLGRDSEIATKDEKGSRGAWPDFEERSFEAYRSYYGYLSKGTMKVEYTVRLNNVGEFSMPPTRVEAMYAPEMFGETPNDRIKVQDNK